MKKYETKVQELDVHRKEIIQMVKNGSSQKEMEWNGEHIRIGRRII